MSERILNEILKEISAVNTRLEKLEDGQAKLENGQAKLESGQAKLESSQAKMAKELREFREETRADLHVLKAGQKGLRAEITDRFREMKDWQHSQDQAIELLNQRQFKLEVEVEQLKSR